MRVIPRRHRFAVLRVMAVLGLPVLRLLPQLRHMRRWHLNSDREIALYLLLNILNRHEIGHDAEVRFERLDLLDKAMASKRGSLIIAPHTPLLFLAIRYLHETRGNVMAVTAPPNPGVRSGRSTVPKIWRSPTFLIDVRDALGEGRTVFAMIDRANAEAEFTTPIPTPVGTLHVADALIRLAVRREAAMVFMAGWPDARGISCRVAAPRVESTGDPDAIVADFGRFLRGCAERLERNGGGHDD